MASVPVTCELVAGKHCLAWKWTKVTNWVLEDEVEITEVASGRDFVVYLTTSGHLLHCGKMPEPISYEKFRLRQGRRRSGAHAAGVEFKRLTKRERELYDGHTCDSRCCPIKLPMSMKVRVLQVACGVTHCEALGEVSVADGLIRRLFAWGVGEYGQLGLGECQVASIMTPITASPKLDALLQNLDQSHPVVLRCGAFSTYLLSHGSTMLWHWGLLPSTDDSRYVRQGVPVQFPFLDENTRLVDVAAGLDHVVLLSKDGSVFTWGYDSSGQLGMGPSITSNVDSQPTRVDFFGQKDSFRTAAISCGWNHTIAISTNGDVYGWGSNMYGACGTKSKFCEYFHPVLVAVPRSDELGLISSNSCAQIRCGGHSSALLLRDEFSEIKRAFVWGVSSPGVGTLMPVEVLPRGGQQSKFSDCFIRLNSSMWLTRVSSGQDVAPAWIINAVMANAESRQGLEKGIPSLNVNVDAKICIKVQAINKIAAVAIAALPEKYCEAANSLFEVALEHDDPASRSDDKVYTIMPISSVTRTPLEGQLGTHSAMEITITAHVKGKGIVSLSSSIGEVIGGKFVIDVASQSESEASAAHGNQDSRICILGVHIEGTEAKIQERVDSRWYKLLSKRIRVYTNDSVILLIESTDNTNLAVQVEYRNNHWQYELTQLDVVGNDNKSQVKTLGVVQLRFPSPGQYFVFETKTHDDERDHRSPLLAVNCCMTSQERKQAVTENYDLVWARFQAAVTSAQTSAQFSMFLSSILQHSILRESIVCSPWVSTYDELCSESSFDFDRERDAQLVLMLHPERPFILWDEFLTTTSTLDSVQQNAKGADSLTLSSILPNWAALLSSKISVRIASWLGKPKTSSTKSLDELPIELEEDRASAGTVVQQNPFDFLGNESLVHRPEVRDALMPVNPNIVGVYGSIVSWKRMNGDLFYTVHSNNLLAQRYSHDSHDFPETAQSGRITRLKCKLSDFLWQAAEGKKLEDTFFLLTSPTSRGQVMTEDRKTLSINGVIYLRDLIFHTTALGFNEIDIPKQEWFALYRAIQALSPPYSAGISFSTFRTFLIDPVHQFFWKQYVHQIREQANSNRAMVTQALSESFKTNERVTSGAQYNNDIDNARDDEYVTPWSDFVDSLKNFHNLLGLQPLPPSDCCRLLYRFDARGNGQISIQSYQNAILHTLDEIDAATQANDLTKTQRTKPSKGKQKMKVAIANGHRRPNVEFFTSSEAVHKLFTARAKTHTSTSSLSRASSLYAIRSSRTITSRATDAAAKLRVSANTHLARIRNLPISHLLREGIHFRPPRETLYRCEDETQAQTTGAEESY